MNDRLEGERAAVRSSGGTRILGVDARAANVATRAGVGTYCYELLRAMAPMCHGCTLRLYLDRPPLADFPLGGEYAEIRILPSTWAWTQRALRKELRRDPPDVFFAPSTQVPLGVRCPIAVTVHDLAFFDFGRHFTWETRTRSRLQARHAVRRANHLLAVSESTRSELNRLLNVSPDKVTVTPHGVSAAYFATPDEGAMAALRDRYALPERYILYVGRLQPRKNIERLIDAFALLRSAHRELSQHLVIVGDKGWMYDEIFQRAQSSPFSEQVQFLGFVAEEHLPELMRGADVFALVSLWEGFGIPVIEAMACGTAVVTSNCSSLPEVVGDAAVTVDPYSVEDIAEGLAKVLTTDGLRESLRVRGLERARRFTWQATAKLTMEVLLRLASEGGARR